MVNGNGKRTLRERYQWIATTLATILTPLMILGLIWLVGVGNTQDFQDKEIATLKEADKQQQQIIGSIKTDVIILKTQIKAVQKTLEKTATKDDIKSLKEFMLMLDKKKNDG